MDTVAMETVAIDTVTMDTTDIKSSTSSCDSLGLKHGFSHAFEKQNVYMETAIKSLDSLNDQIIQFIFASRPSELDFENELSAKDREALKSSMGLMRRLLVDAQTKFRKMVEDNKRLAARIDSSIHVANQEVSLLREELNDTNRRLSQISDVASGDDFKHRFPNNDLAAAQQRSNMDAEEIARLRQENGKLENLIQQMRQEIEEVSLRSTKLAKFNVTDESKINELKLDLIQTRQELNRAKDALNAMKADRKRLKAEKLDLLSQMKQLYCTLEDKEAELRDFIRNYEQRMRESDESIKQFAQEKEASEREKWEILKRARETSERAVKLRTEIDAKDQVIEELKGQLRQAREQLSALGHLTTTSVRTSLNSDTSMPLQSPSHSSSGVGPSLGPSMEGSSTGHSMYENSSHTGTPTPEPPNSARSYRSVDSTYSTPRSTPRSPIRGHSSPPSISSSLRSLLPTLTCSSLPNGSLDNLTPIGESSRSSEELNDGIYVTIGSDYKRNLSNKKEKRKSLGTFSKMFGKSRSRRSITISDPSIQEEGSSPPPRLSMLTQENYQEKLNTLMAAKDLHPAQWKAGMVLAWLEIDMNMPTYGKACAENIKSGRVLLGLSDSELESALSIEKPLHRRKLRLAIEEVRDGSSAKYPRMASLDHTWIAHRWIHDIGLPQYSAAFEEHLVDGRLLNALSKKDLEKYLGIHRKFHHASILHGVELLRRINFDKEVLSQRRAQCEDTDTDPIVWTNQRLIKWADSIDLSEYSSHLKESGVHGAVLVLEPTFNSEAMAAALGIPPSKSYVRRHLSTEMANLVKPARSEEADVEL